MTGTPQGGVISPVLCNVYLHRLDRQWAERGTRGAGALRGRPGGDVPHQAGGRGGARGAAVDPGRVGPRAQSRPRPGSCTCGREARGWTSSASITAGCAGTRGYRHLRFLARWPSREAMQQARDRIREITDSQAAAADPVEVIVQDLNRFLRGWASYFRYGNSAACTSPGSPPMRSSDSRCSWPSATSGHRATA